MEENLKEQFRMWKTLSRKIPGFHFVGTGGGGALTWKFEYMQGHFPQHVEIGSSI